MWFILQEKSSYALGSSMVVQIWLLCIAHPGAHHDTSLRLCSLTYLHFPYLHKTFLHKGNFTQTNLHHDIFTPTHIYTVIYLHQDIFTPIYPAVSHLYYNSYVFQAIIYLTFTTLYLSYPIVDHLETSYTWPLQSCT